MGATRGKQRLHVFDQRGTRKHRGAGVAQFDDLLRREARRQRFEHATPIGRAEHRALGIAIRIAEAHAQHEAVELRIGQRIGAGEVERILRRDHEERRWQSMGDAVDRHLFLGHRFEQRALRLRHRTVDFVGKQQLREQGSRMKLEAIGIALEDADADDVRGQQVGGELHALETESQRRRQRVRERGLADAGQILDQQMAAGEQADEGEADLAALAEDDGVDLGDRARQRIAQIRRQGGVGWFDHAINRAASGRVLSAV